MFTSHRAGRAVVAGAVVWLALLPGTAAAAPPQLSIAVDNDHEDVRTGDTLEYKVTIRNLGTSDVKALRVTQNSAPGLEVKSAKPAGRRGAEGITWRLNVKANGTATVRSTMTVVAAPKDTKRIATVACARMSADAPPIVCATHSARLPTGEPAAAASTSDTAIPLWWPIGGAAALLSAAAATFVVLRRRTRRRPADA
jgi:uncharacterized repeat protein (TIGR01451 family)